MTRTGYHGTRTDGREPGPASTLRREVGSGDKQPLAKLGRVEIDRIRLALVEAGLLASSAARDAA